MTSFLVAVFFGLTGSPPVFFSLLGLSIAAFIPFLGDRRSLFFHMKSLMAAVQAPLLGWLERISVVEKSLLTATKLLLLRSTRSLCSN